MPELTLAAYAAPRPCSVHQIHPSHSNCIKIQVKELALASISEDSVVRHPANRTPLGWNHTCLPATTAIPASELRRNHFCSHLWTPTNIYKPALGELLLKNKTARSPTDTDILRD